MPEVELIMPKMGESIIEATIINWLKDEGDKVEVDETVLEIATDKVDSEVPSPVSGTIKKILYKKDDVVAVGKVVALIESDEESRIKPVALESPPSASATTTQTTHSPTVHEQVKTESQSTRPTASLKTKTIASLTRKSLAEQIPSNVDGRFYSPLVRNIARAEGISVTELGLLIGSGADGRVTKYDLLNYIDLKKLEGATLLERDEMVNSEKAKDLAQKNHDKVIDTPKESVEIDSSQQKWKENITDQRSSNLPTEQPKRTSIQEGNGDDLIELSRMRKVIATHMRNSLDTAAHVTTVVEADATKLVQWRNRVKSNYLKKYGEKLTFSPLFTEAVIKALRDYPHLNGSLTKDHLIVKKSINIGIATAMENGNLIVPVIHEAGDLNINGLAKKLNDLTARARVNKLKPEEIQGGTFTISNIGTFGNIMGTPIINQPELAVLALGAIKKKPIIQETAEGDIIAIRHMMFLSLSFDHRVIDGYQGGVFLNRIAHYIETFDVDRPL